MSNIYEGEIEIDGKIRKVRIKDLRGLEARTRMASPPGLSVLVACGKGAVERLLDIEFMESIEDIAHKTCGKATDWLLERLKAKRPT